MISVQICFQYFQHPLPFYNHKQDKWIYYQVIYSFVQTFWQINFYKLFLALLLVTSSDKPVNRLIIV